MATREPVTLDSMATSPSTGVPALDTALDGLYWGDNVVWFPDRTETATPFFAAIANLAPDYDQAAYVTLTRSPDDVRTLFPA